MNNDPFIRDFVTLNKSVINYLPRCSYHLLYSEYIEHINIEWIEWVNVTIIIPSRFWEVDYSVSGSGGTCQSMQPDGSCTSVYIPACVDRTVYCNPLTTPGNSSKSILAQPNPLNQVELGTSMRFTCPLPNYYFNYSVPSNLTSFFYSTNINSTTLTCNKYK